MSFSLFSLCDGSNLAFFPFGGEVVKDMDVDKGKKKEKSFFYYSMDLNNLIITLVI